MAFNEEVTRHSVHTLVFRSLKRTHDMFLSDAGQLPAVDGKANNLWMKTKARSTYGPIMDKVNNEKVRGGYGINPNNPLALGARPAGRPARCTASAGSNPVRSPCGAQLAQRPAQQAAAANTCTHCGMLPAERPRL